MLGLVRNVTSPCQRPKASASGASRYPRQRRAVLITAMLLCCAPSARAAEPGYVLPPPNAPIFTVAGGGTAAPAIGLPATEVRLYPREAVFLPDGRIIVRHARFSGSGRLVAVDTDGRIAALPAFPQRPVVNDLLGNPVPVDVYDIDLEPDGGVLAAVSGEPSVLRLGPAGWTPVKVPSGVVSIAALPDGGILALTDGIAWWLTRDGAVVAHRALPDGANGSREFTQSVTPLPNGGFVAGSIGGDIYAVLSRPNRPFRRLARLGGDDVGFDDLPDGSLLAAHGPVIRLSLAADTRAPIYGGQPAIGPGDGGPSNQALLAAAGVNTGASGTVLVSEPNGLRHDRPLAIGAFRNSGHIATDVSTLDSAQTAGTLRWIGPPPLSRLFAAIGPTVYQRLAAGRVPVVTTAAAAIRVTVRTGRGIVADQRAAIPAGTHEIDLARRLPQAEYRIALTATNGSQIATYRLGVSTLRVLQVRDAVAAVRREIRGDGDGDGGGGVFFEAKNCRRTGARRVACTYVAVSWGPDHSTTRCAGTVSAYLRADGIRVVRDRTRWHRCPRAMNVLSATAVTSRSASGSCSVRIPTGHLATCAGNSGAYGSPIAR